MVRDLEVRRMCSVLIIGLIGIGFLAGVSGCSKALSASEQRGKSLYSFNCYSCHEENELGLIKVPPKLHRLFSGRYLPDGTTPATDETVREVIVHGKRTMPAFDGRLTSGQISDIVAFLHRK